MKGSYLTERDKQIAKGASKYTAAGILTMLFVQFAVRTIFDNPGTWGWLLGGLAAAIVVAIWVWKKRYLFGTRAEQSASESALEEFQTYYYRHPSPNDAPRMFESYLASWFKKYPTNRPIEEFLFAEIAKGKPEVLRGYEALLPKATHEARLAILKVLSLAGDEKTRKFLEACVADGQFRAEKDAIGSILEAPIPVPVDIFQRPVQNGTDLDLLWAEFFVTGNPRAVVRIIDVLEWPDLLRGRLSAWMQSASPTANQAQTLDQAGFVLDFAHREISNTEDLDIFSVLKDGTDRSADRFPQVRQSLPFPVSDEDINYFATKAGAKWSVASNAYQHPLVLQTCEAEVAKRTGRAKLMLLEVVTGTYLALASKNAEGNIDLALANKDLYSQVKHDLQNSRLIAAEADLRALRALSPNTASAQADDVSNPEAIAQRCALQLEKAPSYMTERMVVARSLKYLESKNFVTLEWHAEFAKPDRYHVTQIAREPDGNEPLDEWITIGDEHYECPAFWLKIGAGAKATTAGRVEINNALLPESFIQLMRAGRPRSARTYLYGGRRYYLFQYEDGSSVLRFWIAADKELLVKIEGITGATDDATKDVPFEIDQTFSGYGLKFQIKPPEPWMFMPARWKFFMGKANNAAYHLDIAVVNPK